MVSPFLLGYVETCSGGLVTLSFWSYQTQTTGLYLISEGTRTSISYRATGDVEDVRVVYCAAHTVSRLLHDNLREGLTSGLP
jgi:hypothetical protein